MTSPAAMMSLATAVPPNALLQTDAQEIARSLFAGRFGSFEQMAPVFANTGIRERRLAQPLDWYVEPRGWPERTRAYLEAAETLFVEAAGRALAAAGLEGKDVDTVVTVSSTGIATPSLEARVMPQMGFRPDIYRVPVFGLGCAGGRFGPLAGGPPRDRQAGLGRPLCHDRALQPGLPPGRADQGQHRRHRPLRRRSRRLRALHRRQRPSSRSRGRPSTPGPPRSTSWAGTWTPWASG